jgi:hypothetical protein
VTEPHDYDQLEALLPGLEPPSAAAGRNERAAHRTIVALKTAGLVDEQHAVMLEALLTAARQLDRASTSTRSKDYGVANLLAQLRETYQVLAPPPAEGGEQSAWDQFLNDLANGVAERGGSTAAVRDTS